MNEISRFYNVAMFNFRNDSHDNLKNSGETLRFSNNELSFNEYYYPNYQSIGYLQRKVIAIPAAIIAAVVKTTYHLAIAIFYGFATVVTRNTKYLRINLSNFYKITRDLEESFGWILTLFNDKRGSYFVQRSLFEKTCYTKYEQYKKPCGAEPQRVANAAPNIDLQQNNDGNQQNHNASNVIVNHAASSNPVPTVTIPNREKAYTFSSTLLDFRKMKKEEREAAIAEFQLQQSIDLIDRDNFFQNLETAAEEILERITLKDLLSAVTDAMLQSKIRLRLKSKDEFKKMTLGQVVANPEYDYDHLEIVAKRLEQFKDVTLPSGPRNNVLDLPIIYLQQIPGAELDKVLKDFNPYFFSSSLFQLLTEVQLKELDFSVLTHEQIVALYRSDKFVVINNQINLYVKKIPTVKTLAEVDQTAALSEADEKELSSEITLQQLEALPVLTQLQRYCEASKIVYQMVKICKEFKKKTKGIKTEPQNPSEAWTQIYNQHKEQLDKLREVLLRTYPIAAMDYYNYVKHRFTDYIFAILGISSSTIPTSHTVVYKNDKYEDENLIFHTKPVNYETDPVRFHRLVNLGNEQKKPIICVNAILAENPRCFERIKDYNLTHSRKSPQLNDFGILIQFSLDQREILVEAYQTKKGVLKYSHLGNLTLFHDSSHLECMDEDIWREPFKDLKNATLLDFDLFAAMYKQAQQINQSLSLKNILPPILQNLRGIPKEISTIIYEYGLEFFYLKVDLQAASHSGNSLEWTFSNANDENK